MLPAVIPAAFEPPEGLQRGIRIRQSDLASYARCPQQKKLQDLQRGGSLTKPPEQLSATAYGSVMHHAVHVMEKRYAQGLEDPLGAAKSTFDHYWDPENIGEICPPVTIWIARETWGGLHRKGLRTLETYWEHLQKDKSKVLGLEVAFSLPYELDGYLHELHGTMDRLSLRRSTQAFLNIEDYKTGRDYIGLRWNQQFTIYSWATLQPAFWDAWGDEGPELHHRFSLLPRRGTWISLRDGARRSDAGWRGPLDYQRMDVALREYIKAVRADIYPLTLTGSVCRFCFTGDVKYWTADGLKDLASTAGTTQRVLTSGPGGATLVDAPIRYYGDSPVHEVVLRCGRGRAASAENYKRVRATPNHEWRVAERSDPDRRDYRVVVTEDLKPGDRLLVANPVKASGKITPSPVGVMAGLVFGDGTIPQGRGACEITLHDGKRELLPYFQGHPSAQSIASTGREVDRVYSLPRFMKEAPDLTEARSYLLGWLAGYFAADGSVSSGQAVLSSSRLEDVEAFRAAAMLCGIRTLDVRRKDRIRSLSGRSYDTPQFSTQLVSDDIPDGFFLRSKHQQALRPSMELAWTVVEVIPNVSTERVFCAEVPGTGNFVLDGWINVNNCPFQEGICGGVELPPESHGSNR